MRVLLIEPGPAFSVQDVANGWSKGLQQNGCQVINYNLADRLTFYSAAEIAGQKAFSSEEATRLAVKGVENFLYEYWPDVVVVVSGFFLEKPLYELMRLRGHKVVLLHTESPYEDSRQIGRAPLVDVNILNDPTNLDRFKDANPQTFYIPHAYDPERHHPRPSRPEHRSDFCFVGTGYPSRVEFLEQVDWSGIDVAFAGNWQGLTEDSPLRPFVAHSLDACCDNEETADLYAGTKASANLYRREATHPELSEGWALGPREVELSAMGTFYLGEPRGELAEVLPMIPTFEGPVDFEDKLRFYLKRDDLRQEIAEQARAAVASRTFENNAAELLRILSQ
jgi:spore maturation protein CgeB